MEKSHEAAPGSAKNKNYTYLDLPRLIYDPGEAYIESPKYREIAGAASYYLAPVSANELITILTEQQKSVSASVFILQAAIGSDAFKKAGGRYEDLDEYLYLLSASGDARSYSDGHVLKSNNTVRPKSRFREEALLRRILASDGLSEAQIAATIDWDIWALVNGYPREYGEIYGNNYADDSIDLLRYVYKHSGVKGAHLPNGLKLLTPLSVALHKKIDVIVEEGLRDGSVDTIEALSFYSGGDLFDCFETVRDQNPALAQEYYKFSAETMALLPEFLLAWPEDLRQSIRLGIINQIANIAFGLIDSSDKEPSYVEFNNKQLEVVTTPQEVTIVMKAIIATIKSIIASNNPHTSVVESTKSSEFSIYRFINSDGTANIFQYIRPIAGLVFDKSIEYGRIGEGVEASIGYVAALESNFVPLGKKAATLDDTISVRIDREGISPQELNIRDSVRRDPTRTIGTLSLDFGSILGNKSNIGVRVGRFLAYSEQRRTGTSPDSTTLNHMPFYFETGEEGYFSDILSREILKRKNQVRRSKMRGLVAAELA